LGRALARRAGRIASTWFHRVVHLNSKSLSMLTRFEPIANGTL
jgi:hypothetical protein